MRYGCLFWNLITSITTSFAGPLLLVGDYESVSASDDKFGGSSHNRRHKAFRDFVANAGTIELGFIGPRFTWSNRRGGSSIIMERLDQGCCNQEWQKLFPKARILHLIAPSSNHKPIRMDTTMEFNNQNRPYRFEAMSIQDPSYAEVVTFGGNNLKASIATD